MYIVNFLGTYIYTYIYVYIFNFVIYLEVFNIQSSIFLFTSMFFFNSCIISFEKDFCAIFLLAVVFHIFVQVSIHLNKYSRSLYFVSFDTYFGFLLDGSKHNRSRPPTHSPHSDRFQWFPHRYENTYEHRRIQ